MRRWVIAKVRTHISNAQPTSAGDQVTWMFIRTFVEDRDLYTACQCVLTTPHQPQFSSCVHTHTHTHKKIYTSAWRTVTMCQSPSQTNVPSTDATDQHRQAGFQRRCTINVERFTELRSPKWQLGHLQIKTENRTVHNCLWLLGRNVTFPSTSVPTQRWHHGALEILIVLYCINCV